MLLGARSVREGNKAPCPSKDMNSYNFKRLPHLLAPCRQTWMRNGALSTHGHLLFYGFRIKDQSSGIQSGFNVQNSAKVRVCIFGNNAYIRKYSYFFLKSTMKNRQFYYYVTQLGEGEIRNFQKYLSCTYLCKKPDLGRIFVHYQNLVLLSRSTEQVSEESLWQAAFPARPFDPGYLKRRMSDLQQELFRYFEMDGGSRDIQGKNLVRIKELNRRRRNRYLNKHLRQARQELKDMGGEDDGYFHARFQLAQEEARLHSINEVHMPPEVYAELTNSIDSHFLLHKLKLACLAFNQEMKPLEGPVPLSSLLNYCAQHLDRQAVLVKCYFHIYSFLLFPNESTHYFHLLDLLKSNPKRFERSECRDLAIYAQNYCGSEIRRGNSAFGDHLKELFAFILEENILLDEKGRIENMVFKNAVTLLCRSGQVAEALAFIRDFRTRLSSDSKDLVVAYAEGLVHAKVGAKEEARGSFLRVVLLSGSLPDDVHGLVGVNFVTTAMRHIALLNFDLRDQDNPKRDHFGNHLRKFKRFVQGNRNLSEQNRRRYVRFISNLKSMYSIEIGKPDARPEKRLALAKQIRLQPISPLEISLLRRLEDR